MGATNASVAGADEALVEALVYEAGLHKADGCSGSFVRCADRDAYECPLCGWELAWERI
jgi:hypothetical protein